jgi:hypothetical protein
VTVSAEEFLRTDQNRKVGKEQVKRIAEALVARGLDVEDLGRLSKIKMWQGHSKDADDNVVVTDLWGFQLAPSWETGPEWPVVQPAAPVKVKARADAVRSPDVHGWQRALILPDIQAGYFRSIEDRLEPIHDIAAIEVALAVMQVINPDITVMLGDNLDLPEFGRYRQQPAFSRTTQKAIDYMHALCARIDSPRKVWLAGNHEERLPNFVIDNAKASFALKQANSPEAWPVLSVPHLCRLDEVGVEYIPGYPAGNLWLNQNLRIIHGYKVKSNGTTSDRYLDSEKVSVIYGHIHRREWTERTRQDHNGPATVMAASPGCLARTDGVVPGVHSGQDLDGRPMSFQENWQQGFAVVDFNSDGRFSYQQVAIHQDGDVRWCRFGNRTFESTFDASRLI